MGAMPERRSVIARKAGGLEWCRSGFFMTAIIAGAALAILRRRYEIRPRPLDRM